MPVAYAVARLSAAAPGNHLLVLELQRHLRKLGYFAGTLDGRFGDSTDRAVRGLQHDLMHNDGASRGGDGRAGVRLIDFNRGRVGLVDGIVDQALADCMANMLADPAFCKVPESANAVDDNRRVRAQLAALRGLPVPLPFLMAIFKQESGRQHYREPSSGNADSHVIVGLDRNASEPHVISSRGYGIGQYTLFHHPPRPEELSGFIVDPVGNVQRAARELQEKFTGFVVGPSSGTRADDRIAEVGPRPLRLCRYGSSDPRYLRDCAQCARSAGTVDIRAGDAVHPGASLVYQPTVYYAEAAHAGVPLRREIPCDWPYAVRRYNGSGVNSYHYQAIVLRNLLEGASL